MGCRRAHELQREVSECMSDAAFHWMKGHLSHPWGSQCRRKHHSHEPDFVTFCLIRHVGSCFVLQSRPGRSESITWRSEGGGQQMTVQYDTGTR